MVLLSVYNQIGAVGLKSLSDGFEHLKQLIILDLSNNDLVSLPPYLGDLPRIARLDISKNPLLSPPASAAAKWSVAQIQQYCRSLGEDGAGPLPRVRLMFVGAGGVGKTTLCKALTLLEKDQTEDESAYLQSLASPKYNSTHGIDVCHWRLDEVTFNVWDFAGQPEYYAGHQQFLADTQAIYVVVYRTVVRVAGSADEWRAVTRDEATRDICVWLSALRSRLRPERIQHAGLCPAVVMVVGTHLDVAQRHKLTEQVSQVALELQSSFNRIAEGLVFLADDVHLVSYSDGLATFAELRTLMCEAAKLTLDISLSVVYPRQVMCLAKQLQLLNTWSLAKTAEMAKASRRETMRQRLLGGTAAVASSTPAPQLTAVMKLRDLQEFLVHAKVLPTKDGLTEFVEVLHATGDVIFFPDVAAAPAGDDDDGGRGVVFLEPQLAFRAASACVVRQDVLSSGELAHLQPLPSQNGQVKRSDVIVRLEVLIQHYRMAVKPAELLDVMLLLKVCFLRGTECVFFPSLVGKVPPEELERLWPTVESHDSAFPTDCALRWQCATDREVDPGLPPGFMLNLQHQLASVFGEVVWEHCFGDCVVLRLRERHQPLSVIFRHTKKHRGIDVRIRGGYHEDVGKVFQCAFDSAQQHYPGLELECVLSCMVGVGHCLPAEQLCSKKTRLLILNRGNLKVVDQEIKVPVRDTCTECSASADTVYTPQWMLDRCVGSLLEHHRSRFGSHGVFGLRKPAFRLSWDEPGIYSRVQHVCLRAHGSLEEYGNTVSFGAISEEGDLAGVRAALDKSVIPWASGGASSSTSPSSSSCPRFRAIVSAHQVVYTKSELLHALASDADSDTTVVHLYGHGHGGAILSKADPPNVVHDETRKGKEEALSEEPSPQLVKVPVAEIIEALSERKNLRCVLLSVSHSEHTSQQIVHILQHIRCCVGIDSQQEQRTVCRFVEEWYVAMLGGLSVAEAVECAKSELAREGLSCTYSVHGDGSWVVWPQPRSTHRDMKHPIAHGPRTSKNLLWLHSRAHGLTGIGGDALPDLGAEADLARSRLASLLNRTKHLSMHAVPQDPVAPLSFKDVDEALSSVKPYVLHYIGHACPTGLYLCKGNSVLDRPSCAAASSSAAADPRSADAFKPSHISSEDFCGLLARLKERPRLVVLQACQTLSIANMLVEKQLADVVLCTTTTVLEPALRSFNPVERFYELLLGGETFRDALKLAKENTVEALKKVFPLILPSMDKKNLTPKKTGLPDDVCKYLSERWPKEVDRAQFVKKTLELINGNVANFVIVSADSKLKLFP